MSHVSGPGLASLNSGRQKKGGGDARRHSGVRPCPPPDLAGGPRRTVFPVCRGGHMLTCKQCGYQNDEGETFCRVCGSYLGWGADPSRRESGTSSGSPKTPLPAEGSDVTAALPAAVPEAADRLKSRLAVEDPYDRARRLAIPVTPVAPSAGKSSEQARSSSPPMSAESRRVEIGVAPGQPAVEPGGEGSCQVRVRNSGTIVEQFSLELVGDDTAWAVVGPATLNVYPGTDMSATIRLRPPRTSRTLVGRHPD